ncbi:MAG: ROK family protein [Acidobacteriota bacterium]
MNNKLVVGVDLGGTTVKTGLITRSGEILALSKLPTLADDGPKAVLGQIRKSIEEVIAHAGPAEVTGIGIGSPGIIEKNGIVKAPPNFRNWTSIPMADEISFAMKIHTEVDNDANTAAIAESKFGAGREFPNFLFIIWGTGVGGGIIMNGQIYRGPHGGAGEVGHISIDHNGPVCNCGSRGCVEAYVGQRYLSARTAEKLKSHPESKINELIGGDLSKVEPLYISQAAHEGDPLAREIFTEAGRLLGVMIGGVMNTLDYRITIVGGGVSAAGQFVFDAITESAKASVQAPLKAGIRVIPAQLGNTAGMLGAAGLVL